MDDPFIIAYDIGTSSIKTSIVRTDGTVMDSVTTAHQTFFPQPSWAEQDPEDWWKGACSNTHVLIERHPEIPKQISAIGVSGHMLGCLPVDSNGNALRRCMIHSDTRCSKEFDLVKKQIGIDTIYNSTGNILSANSSLCKALWIKKNEPGIYKQASRFLQSKDFLVSRLTGNVDTTDFSDASHGHLIDIHKKEYNTDIFIELGLDRRKFPALHKGTDIVGKLNAASASALNLPEGIPVAAGAGDGACANAGAGIVKPGDIYCCLGTTAWIAYNSNAPIVDPSHRIFNIMSVDGETYGVFGTIQAAGRSLQWVMELLNERDVKEFDRKAASADPGSNGLVFLPYLEGERSPIFDSNARGVFFGITPSHDRTHFMRAVLEGVAMALRSVLEVYREKSVIPSMRIIGGGAKSDIWQKIISNTCNIVLQRLNIPAEDSTSIGVAITAAVGVGLFSSVEDGAKLIGTKGRYSPEERLVDTYNKAYKIYQSLYPRLKPVYTAMANMNSQ